MTILAIDLGLLLSALVAITVAMALLAVGLRVGRSAAPRRCGSCRGTGCGSTEAPGTTGDGEPR